MEGEIDTSHISFLHKSGNMEDTLSKGASIADDGAPVIFIKETSCGFYYGARRRYKDHFYWRVSHWLMPMWSVIPATPEEYFGHGRGWVPVDDYWTTTFAYRYRIDRPLNESDMAEIRDGVSFPPRMNRGSIELPHGYIIDTFLPTANRGNDYLIDRSIQRTQSFTGIFGINEQDRGLQESMPSAPGERPGIVDRSEEHLVASDAPTVKARWMLMRMAKDLEDGKEAQAVRHADMYGVRSIAKLSSIGDWDEFIAENVQLMQATFRPEQQAAAISSQRPQA